ncbi:integral membrane protein [Cordyceps fumosorosea ARSEF 2679]|uniref:Integral membrane protein n=1 Tax=Cordyceps fumosorosea (strain ARSEF 2679) TaxID=1081104 RepID=A0A167LEE2_CORFA|nr:integral membrane protein [Cordyceps fumosorosea ARSEF 2679]OAA52987.1 integral membrane protein [Cordyceps fumosorosea ARSEF 2679]
MGGVQRRGDHVPDRGPALIRILWLLAALAGITAVLRVVVRSRNRMFGWGDIFMIFTMTGPDNVADVLFLSWLSQVFGIMGVAAGKISVAALLLAIIPLTELRWQRVFLWIVPVTLASLVAIACSTLTFAQCAPAAALWDQGVEGECIDPHVMSSFGTFTGAFNTFTDGSLAIISATIFWQLNNTTTEKTQLTIVFGLNILTSICSGIKTQYLAELANRTNQTWATYDIFVWVSGELFFMIVCGGIPTLHTLLAWFHSAAKRVTASSSWQQQREQQSRSSRKGSARLTSDADTDKNEEGWAELAELRAMAHLSIQTKTTVERVRPRSDSVDWLFEHKNGVRVEIMYDVRRDTRPNSAVPPIEPRGGHP